MASVSSRAPGDTHCPICGNSYSERKGMDCPEIHSEVPNMADPFSDKSEKGNKMDKKVREKIVEVLNLDFEATDLDILEAIVLLKNKPVNYPGLPFNRIGDIGDLLRDGFSAYTGK